MEVTVWSFFDDNGLIRCGGRLENAYLPHDTRFSILLESGHPVCRLIVIDCHERVKHNGVKETLTQLRSTFWIIKGQSVIQKIIQPCFICRKLEGPHYQLPSPPPSPVFSVNRGQPFSVVGVDFAGPLFIKTSGVTSKVWICLYTCAIVRAVHLDIVRDLNTTTFLRSFRRFCSRQGLPHLIISDNCQKFKAVATIVRRMIASSEAKEHFHNHLV